MARVWLFAYCCILVFGLECHVLMRTSQLYYFIDLCLKHDDVIKWKHFPRYWPFGRRIHRCPVISPHKGQWQGASMFSLICAWINASVNNREAGFYTPVWKTGRIMPWQCPSVRLSVRLSVRPSVRPCFPDFSSTCFEISIWNLVYTFSRWHDMSSLSCITIGSLWPSLQPKVGQTYFLQSRPHKSR